MSPTVIDKLAFLHIKDRKILVTLNKGKDIWYIPGGKREPGESDLQALIREVREELSVNINPKSTTLYKVFEAQAHGKPEGTLVRMTCYTGTFTGTLTASSEVSQLDFFTHRQKHLTGPVDHLILDDLKANRLID
jgi:8-oxo-dGTP diphosphatase